MYQWVIIGVLLAGIVGAWYYDHSTSRATIQDLIEHNATLDANVKRMEEANKNTAETLDRITADYEKVLRQFEEVNTEFQVIRLQRDELKARLDGHDLTAIGIEKPEVLEKLINNASDKVLRCFELISGSPKNQAEINATTEREFNSECPWLQHKE